MVDPTDSLHDTAEILNPALTSADPAVLSVGSLGEV